MPRKTNSSPPPKAMTWRKAMPVLILAAVFDALRAFFQFFWLFGPALLGVQCAVKVGGVWVVGKALVAACVAGATAVGVTSFAVTSALGTIMAMAVGLIGWLTLGLVLMIKNTRIFRENFLWFGGGLVGSQIPFISALPVFTATMWRLHRAQIKEDQAALKKWHKENDAAILKERNDRQRQAAMTAQIQMSQIAQKEQAQSAQQQEQQDQDIESEEANADEKTYEQIESAPPQAHVQLQPVPPKFLERTRTTLPPHLTAVPNYAGPSKITNPK